MCESYLSQLTGGQVEVRKAALSIFEGLRLDGVSIRVDKATGFDSTLLEVGTVLIKYNPESILNGKLEATQIIAIDPRVRLCENLDAKKWNYQRMTLPTQRRASRRSERSDPATSTPSQRALYYSQILDGKQPGPWHDGAGRQPVARRDRWHLRVPSAEPRRE